MCFVEIKYGEKIWSLKKYLWFFEFEDIVCSIYILINGEWVFYVVVKRVSELIVFMVSVVYSEYNSFYWCIVWYGDYVCYNNNDISNWEINELKYVY